jgi:hypothetical protein
MARRRVLLELERPAREDQDAVGFGELIERVAQRREPVGPSGGVQVVEPLVEQPRGHLAERVVAQPAGRAPHRLEPRADRRDAPARHGEQVRDQHGDRHALGLGGDVGTEQEHVGDHHVGRLALELGAHVGGEAVGRSGHDALERGEERLLRVLRLPVLDDLGARLEALALRCGRPGHVGGAGRLDLGG